MGSQEDDVTSAAVKKKEPIALKFAPFWKRMIAYLIDIMIVRILFAFIINYFFGKEIEMLVSQQTNFGVIYDLLIKFFNQHYQLLIAQFILEASYFSLLWRGSGQTAGARIMGIAIISVERKHINIFQGIFRYSLLAIAERIAFLPLIFIVNPVYRQRLHDYFTDSVAVEMPKMDRNHYDNGQEDEDE
jgi:uncharacterized RDD family membrane protein YckC